MDIFFSTGGKGNLACHDSADSFHVHIHIAHHHIRGGFTASYEPLLDHINIMFGNFTDAVRALPPIPQARLGV